MLMLIAKGQRALSSVTHGCPFLFFNAGWITTTQSRDSITAGLEPPPQVGAATSRSTTTAAVPRAFETKLTQCRHRVQPARCMSSSPQLWVCRRICFFNLDTCSTYTTNSSGQVWVLPEGLRQTPLHRAGGPGDSRRWGQGSGFRKCIHFCRHIDAVLLLAKAFLASYCPCPCTAPLANVPQTPSGCKSWNRQTKQLDVLAGLKDIHQFLNC